MTSDFASMSPDAVIVELPLYVLQNAISALLTSGKGHHFRVELNSPLTGTIAVNPEGFRVIEAVIHRG